MIFDDDKETLDKLTYFPDDTKRLRDSIFTRVTNQLQKTFPLDWGGIRLEAKNVHLDNDKSFSKSEQKKYLLEDKYLTKKLKADLYLYDSKSNQLLDKNLNKTIMNVPYYTDRGTFIHGGNEYTSIKQDRLRPGIYSRKKQNGELETQFNIKRGTGSGYRISFDPASSIYKFNIGQSSVNLYTILHDLGVEDKTLKDVWGEDVLNANRSKYDSKALEKIYQKLVPAKDRIAETRDQKIEILKNAFLNQKVDIDIISKTLI